MSVLVSLLTFACEKGASGHVLLQMFVLICQDLVECVVGKKERNKADDYEGKVP